MGVKSEIRCLGDILAVKSWQAVIGGRQPGQVMAGMGEIVESDWMLVKLLS